MRHFFLLSFAVTLFAGGTALGQAAPAKSLASGKQAGAADNSTESLEQLVARVQKGYDATRVFVAKFEQSYRSKVFKRVEKSRGTVSYQRPGKMRFDYSAPVTKTFLVDGKALWIIQPRDHQALVDRCFKADALTSSLTFLFGQGKLAEQFEISEKAKAPAGQRRLALKPRTPQGAYQMLYLDVDVVSARVVASTVVDPQGNLNRFVFSKARYLGTVEPKRFVYQPPKGITVMPIPGSCTQPQ